MANCNWCGEDLIGASRSIWWDDDGNKYCSRHCFMNSNAPIPDSDDDQEEDEEEDYEY
jgi:hypothetical protein